jgi:GT2 family glycosyltransferase
MKDLRIVIVSWNVEQLLDRCLRSLSNACRELSWDVVVVDNASRDGSVAVAEKLRRDGALPITVIANADNRGFARACNQGIAGNDARYVLLLNPDTECPAGSLTDLVAAGDRLPKAGILGPRLTYPDGRYQESVRRFPNVWNQLCILLRLHILAPWLGTVRRYFWNDLDTSREQRVEQVMGACFLIRADVIEEIGGLDERYFIWFEEVDYCRMAIAHGWEVYYVPSIAIIHHGGRSFGQLFSVTKQRMFNASLLSFFRKWEPGWRAKLIHAAMPVSLGIAHLIDALRAGASGWGLWFGLLLIVEALSLATVFTSMPRAIVTALLGIGMAFLAVRKPSIGLAALLLELMVGSKGALTKIPEGMEVDGGTSLRIVLVGAFFAGWFFQAIRYWLPRRRQLFSTVRQLIRGRVAWIALAGLCVWGVVNGMSMNQSTFWQDANAWMFLSLLVPVLDCVHRDGAMLRRFGRDAAIAALLWLPIKTLLLLYVFSHGIPSLSQPLYLWVRRTGVGEVTLVVGNLFRLFIQSQVYAIIAWLLFAAYAAERTRKEISLRWWLIGIGSLISLLMSLSRSFWIGLAAGGIVTIALTYKTWTPRFIAWCGRLAAPVFIALAVLFGVVAFPVPYVEVGSLATLFGSRGSTTDAAAASRWNLLPVLVAKIKEAPILGSGFGATVTYQTRDPRILAKHPDGMYTTSAFEWGWLEHWIKFGIFGIPVILWLLLSIGIRVWRTPEPRWMRVGGVSSLVALAALHVFTPYLNHPLGFGVLLAMEAWIEVSQQSDRAV